MFRRTAGTLRPIPGYEIMDKGICGRGALLLDLCHVGRATDIEGSGSGEAKSGGGKDDVGDHEGHEGKGPAVELEHAHGSSGLGMIRKTRRERNRAAALSYAVLDDCTALRSFGLIVPALVQRQNSTLVVHPSRDVVPDRALRAAGYGEISDCSCVTRVTVRVDRPRGKIKGSSHSNHYRDTRRTHARLLRWAGASKGDLPSATAVTLLVVLSKGAQLQHILLLHFSSRRAAPAGAVWVSTAAEVLERRRGLNSVSGFSQSFLIARRGSHSGRLLATLAESPFSTKVEKHLVAPEAETGREGALAEVTGVDAGVVSSDGGLVARDDLLKMIVVLSVL